MPRAAATSDVFNAIAEPRRRQIIELLVGEEGRDVTQLVRGLRIPQPAVSKHLRVLRSVRLVSVIRRGRRRVYRLNARQLRPVHEWVKAYEKFWSHQLSRIKERAERIASASHPRQETRS